MAMRFLIGIDGGYSLLSSVPINGVEESNDEHRNANTNVIRANYPNRSKLQMSQNLRNPEVPSRSMVFLLNFDLIIVKRLNNFGMRITSDVLRIVVFAAHCTFSIL